jgi:hypothetical protein
MTEALPSSGNYGEKELKKYQSSWKELLEEKATASVLKYVLSPLYCAAVAIIVATV